MFIILGIIIVMAAAVIFYMMQPKEEIEIEVPTDFQNVNQFVSSCVSQVTKTAVQDMALNGGYYYFKLKHVDLNYSQPMYYYADGEIRQPSRARLESEIAVYVETELDGCISNFSAFDKGEYSFKQQPPKATVQVNAEDVLVNIDFPIEITKGGKKFELSKFSSKIDARLGYMSTLAEKIVQSSVENKGLVDFTLADSFNDVTTNIEGINDSVVVYSIVDEKEKIDGYPLILMFAIQSPIIKPYFEINDSYSLRENQLFTLDLKPNKNVSFYSSSALVNLTDDGKLSIQTEVVGDYSLTIRAIDSENREYSRNVVFKITK
jgi:hypothetical protein